MLIPRRGVRFRSHDEKMQLLHFIDFRAIFHYNNPTLELIYDYFTLSYDFQIRKVSLVQLFG